MRKKNSHNELGKPGAALNNAAAGDTLALRFLYRTAPGRMLLKLLIQPKVSEAAGRYLSSSASKWLVPYYIRKHDIDMKGVEIPQRGFASFNDFFTRKRTTDDSGKEDGYLCSPCDGWLSAVRIRRTTVLMIKATRFSLRDLLGDAKLAEQFRDGEALIFRLTPADYHRYCYAADGQILFEKKIDGKLHCVRPIALRGIPVFAQNSREYQVIRTERFGTMVQMEIGALLVGKIKNHDRMDAKLNSVQSGEEKGYFEFGGSTIILLFQKDAVRVSMKEAREKNAAGEVRVHMGECIAKCSGKPDCFFSPGG
ncbi:MAG: phosphatidylserine decarboxylase [Lachnospiraceae bacterium]|nr:phosphatidylserine decarboxylase [Lachnospiraceae bacterium]MDE7240050.1 phosphatidylserine decarboxylase [Lachnospiraceae bacterium]